MAVDNDMLDGVWGVVARSTAEVQTEIPRLASEKTSTLKIQVIEKIKAPQGR